MRWRHPRTARWSGARMVTSRYAVACACARGWLLGEGPAARAPARDAPCRGRCVGMRPQELGLSCFWGGGGGGPARRPRGAEARVWRPAAAPQLLTSSCLAGEGDGTESAAVAASKVSETVV